MGLTSEGFDPITGARELCGLCWEGDGWFPPSHLTAIPIRCLQFIPGVNLKPERQDATLTRKRSWLWVTETSPQNPNPLWKRLSHSCSHYLGLEPFHFFWVSPSWLFSFSPHCSESSPTLQACVEVIAVVQHFQLRGDLVRWILMVCIIPVYHSVCTCIQVWDRCASCAHLLKSPSKGSKTIWGNCSWSYTMSGETGEGKAVLKIKVKHENCLESWEVIVQEVKGVFFWMLYSLLRWWHSREPRVSPVTACLPQPFCMLLIMCSCIEGQSIWNSAVSLFALPPPLRILELKSHPISSSCSADFSSLGFSNSFLLQWRCWPCYTSSLHPFSAVWCNFVTALLNPQPQNMWLKRDQNPSFCMDELLAAPLGFLVPHANF